MRSLVEAGSIQQAVDLLPTLRSGDDESFTSQSLTGTRRELVRSLLEEARSKRQDSIVELSRRAPIFATAFKLDPTDESLNKLRSETVAAFLSLLSKAPQPQFKSEQSAARYRLALHDTASDLFGVERRNASASDVGAYPALRVNTQIDDPRSCLAANEKDTLNNQITNALRP